MDEIYLRSIGELYFLDFSSLNFGVQDYSTEVASMLVARSGLNTLKLGLERPIWGSGKIFDSLSSRGV